MPLGPESLTWQLFADGRMALLGPRAAVLQNMLPELGQGVDDHSVWFAETMARLSRSVPPIFRTVYGPDPEATGRRVRDFHVSIKGHLPEEYGGGRYHALDPETFYWAHATFVEHMVVATERFIRPLTASEKQRIIDEHVEWFERYGVSVRAVPRTWADFESYWNQMLDERLVRHRVAAYGVGYVQKGWPRPARVPAPLWLVARRPLNAVSAFLTTGGLPPRARELLGLTWTEGQERRYRGFARAVRTLDPLARRLPPRLRLHPIAVRAFAHAAAAAQSPHRPEEAA